MIATAATDLIVALRTGDGPHDLSLLLVDAHGSGVRARRLPGFVSWQCEVAFDGVEVAATNLLGGRENQGWAALERALLRALPVLCSYSPSRCRSFRTSWLIRERGGSDICLKDPGHEVDLVVSADAGAMARVWTGAITSAQAVRDGGLRGEGPRDLVRALPTWLLLSHFVHVERPARAV